jgi:hypothetical protein
VSVVGACTVNGTTYVVTVPFDMEAEPQEQLKAAWIFASPECQQDDSLENVVIKWENMPSEFDPTWPREISYTCDEIEEKALLELGSD